MSTARHFRCPFCGGHVFAVDATCSVYHEPPICAQMDAKLREFGLTARREPWAAVLLSNGGAQVVQRETDAN